MVSIHLYIAFLRLIEGSLFKKKKSFLFSYAFPIWFVLVLHVGFGEK